MYRFRSSTCSRPRSRRFRRAPIAAFSACIVVLQCGCNASIEADRIRAVLTEQDRAWNNGDIDGFMAHYVKSDELTFSSGGNTTRGWQETMKRYRRRYPDKATMGTLRFADLEITLLAPNTALVLGRWHLDRAAGNIGGNFSLVFERRGNRWLIRHDHTSTDPAVETE